MDCSSLGRWGQERKREIPGHMKVVTYGASGFASQSQRNNQLIKGKSKASCLAAAANAARRLAFRSPGDFLPLVIIQLQQFKLRRSECRLLELGSRDTGYLVRAALQAVMVTGQQRMPVLYMETPPADRI